MTWIRGFIQDARAALAHLPLSWVRALSADGDGPPSWFWPSAMTSTVLLLMLGGFAFANDRAGFVIAIIVPFCSFVGLTFGAWLTYRGWRFTRAQKPGKEAQPNTEAG